MTKSPSNASNGSRVEVQEVEALLELIYLGSTNLEEARLSAFQALTRELQLDNEILYSDFRHWVTLTTHGKHPVGWKLERRQELAFETAFMSDDIIALEAEASAQNENQNLTERLSGIFHHHRGRETKVKG